MNFIGAGYAKQNGLEIAWGVTGLVERKCDNIENKMYIIFKAIKTHRHFGFYFF